MESFLDEYVSRQLSCWPLAEKNFRALDGIRTKELAVGGLKVIAQHNPARIVSSAAKTDRLSLEKRPCFLCPQNRFKEQIHETFRRPPFLGYDILVNPFPIFPDHLVIALQKHASQSIQGRYEDLLGMCEAWEDYTFFYNGPKCGASAPDHHHFQATHRNQMPLETDIAAQLKSSVPDVLTPVTTLDDATIYRYERFVRGVFVICSTKSSSSAILLDRLLKTAPLPEGDVEPRLNMICWHEDGQYVSVVIFRKCHRSHHYFSTDADHLTMSPGCADMGGMLVVPCPEDFEKIGSGMLTDMLDEVTLSEVEVGAMLSALKEPLVKVGVMSSDKLEFELENPLTGSQTVTLTLHDGKILFADSLFDELVFCSPFTLHGVTIGKQFHWEQKESQQFDGILHLFVAEDAIQAVNVIDVEDYLCSVISSEMKSTASLEFLKAHAVISRSWLMSRLQPSGEACEKIASRTLLPDGTVEITCWYGQGDHSHFDVCADDHCQRYQGKTRMKAGRAAEAVKSTKGQILMSGSMLCDARFSKCCGGLSEHFSSCWEDRDYPYLRILPDSPGHAEGAKCFCDTSDNSILSQVLNDYDLETKDFFRWSVIYDRQALSELVSRKTGIDLGLISSVVAEKRSESGRITRLRIDAEKTSISVGKELEIRKILSESHLKSSVFDITCLPEDNADWTQIKLDGRGWGHGVGLCQIGAAVMAANDYGYEEILQHYYPDAELKTIY